MSVLFGNLPIGGPSLATDTMAKKKTVVCSGTFAADEQIVIEASADGIRFDAVGQFTADSARVIECLAFEMRAVLVKGSAAGKSVNVTAEEDTSLVFGAIAVPAPGTPDGPVLLTNTLGPDKFFYLDGPMDGANISIQASADNPAGPPTRFAPTGVQWVGSAQDLAREFAGESTALRVRRLNGAGQAGITIGFASALSGAGFQDGNAGMVISVGPTELMDEIAVTSDNPEQIIAEVIVDQLAAMPFALHPTLNYRLNASVRGDTVGRDGGLSLRQGGTAGVVDGGVILPINNFVLPNVAAPDGSIVQNGVNGIANPNVAGAVRLKVGAAVEAGETVATGFFRAMSIQILPA